MKEIFKHLDYETLGTIYCDEGGDEFWQAHRQPCQQLGVTLATELKPRLGINGRSLYVGAGVAEIPTLLMEHHELHREVMACNLRTEEVEVLNHACTPFNLSFTATNAQDIQGEFDHIWIVSVLNDPELFPELSALSYGRANPAMFDIEQFSRERDSVMTLTSNCLNKLTIPGLITTSVEEIPWITNWCNRESIEHTVGEEDFPTAIVKDPVCFIHIGK